MRRPSICSASASLRKGEVDLRAQRAAQRQQSHDLAHVVDMKVVGENLAQARIAFLPLASLMARRVH